jgi:hypothetical protein
MMLAFHGDLLIGGMAVKNLEVVLEDGSADPSAMWCGQFTVDPCQQEVLELGRQYLLMLDDGRNREVVLTDIQAANDEESVVCEFDDCVRWRTPK